MNTQGYRVFISYSRANEFRKRHLIIHLSALRADGTITIWHDRCIEAGSLWREELDRALNDAEVALFLVSADFLNSPFCQDVEVPQLLKRHTDEGVLIVPIIIDHCEWEHIGWINQFQVLPDDGKPVIAQKPQSKAWTQVARGLRKCLTDNPPRKIPYPVSTASGKPEGLEQLSLEHLLQSLPGETERLFGRGDELGWLHHAYQHPQIKVVSLIGSGGVGKSSLTRYWLENQDFTPQGTKRFIGCSFYSQGPREDAGSSDQFLIQILETLGEKEPNRLSPWDRGQRLADIIADEPTVLVLDGLEPLQYGPGVHNLGGQLKDPGIRGLLAGLVNKQNRSFCIVTSRLRLEDDEFKQPSCVQKSIDSLSRDAARELLIYRGVKGNDYELDSAANYLKQHPLALILAAEYLHAFSTGQASNVKDVPLLSEKTQGGRHAKSVMEAYVNGINRDGESLDIEVLRILGLFDRPAKLAWLKALRFPPAIEGITDNLSWATDRQFLESISRLRQWGLLADPGTVEKPELDAHPLIREYFDETLRRENESGWRTAHERLFNYFSSITEKFPETLADMEPLYRSVIHGCKAARYSEALRDVYQQRILRGDEHFSLKTLGAFGIELAMLSAFFTTPWQPVKELNKDDQGFVLNAVGFCLQALGRLTEAINPYQDSLNITIAREDWRNGAAAAMNLSRLYEYVGDLTNALACAQQSVELSNHIHNPPLQIKSQAFLAHVWHQMGRLREAEESFSSVEDMQKSRRPDAPFLHSWAGFIYCDLLLDKGEYQNVRRRVRQTLEWMQMMLETLDIALDHLSLGWSYLLEIQDTGLDTLSKAEDHIHQAIDGLRQAGDQTELPRGLLAQAALHRIKGELDKAQVDLDEAFLIATRNDMKLYKTDCFLEYTRLCIARGEKVKARQNLDSAQKIIERTGYHRRNKDLTELTQLVEAV